MAKKATKTGEKTGMRSRQVPDLSPKGLKARKAASVKGGAKAATTEPYLVVTMKDVIVSG